MSIPFKARFVDLANLVIAKGSNFVVTALLFAVVARGMDTHAFAEFGYWWSIALMIGGVLLGGLSSALVRVAAVHGSLRHLAAPLRRTGLALLALTAGVALSLLAVPEWTPVMLFFGAVGAFGLAVQAQATLLALLRAVEASRANALASVLIVLLVPVALHLMLGSERALPWLFLVLACAYTSGTLVALAAVRRRLAHLYARASTPSPSIARFAAAASSFAAVNLFSYVITNVDFTLFRFVGASGEFALMGTAKVFFERFVVPALMVFAGAISLMVLRHPQAAGGRTVHLEARLSPGGIVAAIATVGLLTAAYWIFVRLIRGDVTSIPLPWIACAATGYVLFAINGVLFDVLVVRRSLVAVLTHVVAFLLLGSALQAIAISGFGVPGWALAWLAFNLIVLGVLSGEGLRLRLSGWTRGTPENDVMEVQ